MPIAAQECCAVAAVVVEGSSSVNWAVHCSRRHVPSCSNVLGGDRMHVTEAEAGGGFWGLSTEEIMGLLHAMQSGSAAAILLDFTDC